MREAIPHADLFFFFLDEIPQLRSQLLVGLLVQNMKAEMDERLSLTLGRLRRAG